jgi:hypothetical protein
MLWHNWRQLEKVTDEEQLDATERRVARTILPEELVDAIHEVTTYHRDLIDDQELKFLVELPIINKLDILILVDLRRELEK